MDDLNGLSWTSTSSPAPPSSAPSRPQPLLTTSYPALRPTPPPPLGSGGRNTPLSAQMSTTTTTSPAFPPPPPPKSAASDSFSNLVSFGSGSGFGGGGGGRKAGSPLTLQEQQDRLQAEKRSREAYHRQQYESQFGHAQFWDGLGSSGGTAGGGGGAASYQSSAATSIAPSPLATTFPAAASTTGVNGVSRKSDDQDLLDAFKADTKVDATSRYPPPKSNGGSVKGASPVPAQSNGGNTQNGGSMAGSTFAEDDDDPFGLGQMVQKSGSTSVQTAPQATTDDDEDFLGDLGKPVEHVRKASPAPVKPGDTADPFDKAVAELVEMGFTAEQSRRALTEGGSGLDIQTAVSFLLNDAHTKSKAARQPSSAGGMRNGTNRDSSRDSSRPGRSRGDTRERGSSQDHSQHTQELDISTTAVAIGNNLFKTANLLWKTSQKKVQRAVADLQNEGDSSQPRWMRESAADRQASPQRCGPEVTDEAVMLEGDRRSQQANKVHHALPVESSSHAQVPWRKSPAQDLPPPLPRWQSDPRSRLSKQAIEEQTAQAYVSPARRKKTPEPSKAQVQPQAPVRDDVDLLSVGSTASVPTTSTQRISPVPLRTSTPITIRPKPPVRTIPPLSAAALKSSTDHRLAGSEHFKRGDYASAYQSYSTSLAAVPESHPIAMVLLCNRALTSLKIGQPRDALTDANAAIALAGPTHGDGEQIDLGPPEAPDRKDMKSFWGKALMRRAEASEQLERWQDARDAWHEAVEANVGGATSIQGRQRCDVALAPPKVKPKAAVVKPKPSKPAPTNGLTVKSDSDAVRRLREADRAAEKAEDERFALSDSIDARIATWREGKRDNLRALLGSLDQVLWEGSGWKKVGLHELVVPGKVKIQYMKAISKCHPDKLPQDATTEVKLIAAIVFATLNESWDAFKAQNNL